MGDRALGKSSVRVSAIGLGCWQFSSGRGLVGGYWPALPQDVVTEVVRASLAGGVSWFDTAEAYGGGASEEALGRALREVGAQGAQATVATKWLPLPVRTARSIVTSVEERLRRLDGFPIALFQIHQPYGSLATHDAQMDALAELVERKKVASVGISNFDARSMRRCHERLSRRGVPLASNQVRFSLLDRHIERDGVLAAAKELGVSIIAYSPLAQGLLSGRFHAGARPAGMRRLLPAFRERALERTRPLIDALRRIGERHGATPSQVALSWAVTFHGDTVVAIPGASSVRQAEENAGALRIELDDAERAELDRTSRAAT